MVEVAALKTSFKFPREILRSFLEDKIHHKSKLLNNNLANIRFYNNSISALAESFSKTDE